MVDKIVTIKTQHKTLEGIRTAKMIEGKKNKIPYKTLEGIRTAKMLNIFNIYSINDIKNKKNSFFWCIYKMVNITKEMYEHNGIEVITDNLNILWLNERYVQQQLGHKKFTSSYKQIRRRIQKTKI